jgi:hypothetical protein
MYVPDFDPDTKTAPTRVNVPIILSTATSSATQAAAAEAEQPVLLPTAWTESFGLIKQVMQPTIYTAAADSTHISAPSAMSDVTEGNHIDFQGMAAIVTRNLQQPVEEVEGMARQIWKGFLDDVFGGPKHGGASKAWGDDDSGEMVLTR